MHGTSRKYAPSKALDIVVVLAVRKEALEKSSALDQAEPDDMGSESSVHLQRSIYGCVWI